jgi:predicted unusual protein kinase regulating ubiquinone biosynthesis (AarF/ABC1/UbiB family)
MELFAMNSATLPILTKVQTRKIPASSFLRMCSLGSSQAKIAAHYFFYAIRKHFAEDEKKKLLKNHFYLKSALQLLGTMGYLRGAIMKAGQLLANLPQIMPRELVEIFESLQFEAPPMHFSLIREVFLDELGREPGEIFAFFEKEAFAAASLGQVHRARLHNGREVAVKIQYPNIAQTIDADMKALSLLLQTMRFTKDFQYLCLHVQDARRVFQKEVDYLSEASFMEKNRKLFAESQIVVPEHYPEFSTKRILTMDYLPGKHLQGFLAGNPSQPRRDHFGSLISYSLVHSWFCFRTVYADLHPGNYILMDDGRLGFIDFGCYRQFGEDRWRLQIDSELAMFTHDEEKLKHFMAKVSMHDDPEDLDPEWVELFLRQMEWAIAPVIAAGPFDFAGKAYAEQGANLIKETLKRGYVRTDSFYNWSNRAIIGHRALMYRLRSKLDYSALYHREMAKYA